jgi:rubredoxin
MPGKELTMDSGEPRDADDAPGCPVCGTAAGDTSWTAAPNQLVCPDTDCPVVSWREDRR